MTPGEHSATLAGGPHQPEGQPLAVMMVEDDPLQARLLAAWVRVAELAATLSVFGDGESALAFLHPPRSAGEPERPEVVLLDLRLPGIGGEDVLRAIRADARTRALPVVVLSNSTDPASVHGAYAAGATWFVAKPRSFEAGVSLMRAVRTRYSRHGAPGTDQVANSGR